ncbi:MAG TPA: hypothetical protein VMV93_12935, partial [Chloroflexota bacterium]|nr:hypothetical protein [Chloroflexota bacterium]
LSTGAVTPEAARSAPPALRLPLAAESNHAGGISSPPARLPIGAAPPNDTLGVFNRMVVAPLSDAPPSTRGFGQPEPDPRGGGAEGLVGGNGHAPARLDVSSSHPAPTTAEPAPSDNTPSRGERWAADEPPPPADIAGASSIDLIAGPFLRLADLASFETALRLLPGVQDVVMVQFVKSMVQLRVAYEDPLPFSARLAELSSFQVTVRDQANGRLEATVRPSPEVDVHSEAPATTPAAESGPDQAGEPRQRTQSDAPPERPAPVPPDLPERGPSSRAPVDDPLPGFEPPLMPNETSAAPEESGIGDELRAQHPGAIGVDVGYSSGRVEADRPEDSDEPAAPLEERTEPAREEQRAPVANRTRRPELIGARVVLSATLLLLAGLVVGASLYWGSNRPLREQAYTGATALYQGVRQGAEEAGNASGHAIRELQRHIHPTPPAPSLAAHG